MLPFFPESAQAQSISNLFILTLELAAGVFLIVLVLVTYASIRFRERKGQGEPEQSHGNRKLEIGWTAAPLILLAVLFYLTIRTSLAADPPIDPQGQQQPDIVITGHQWWWEVRYPAYGVVTANEVHLPTGVRLRARFESADVIHDFWVPQLGPKIDMIPGHPNRMILAVDHAGTYLGTCAEFCGAQHAWMRIRVIAQTPEAFQAWIQAQRQVPSIPSTGLAGKGAQLFQQLTCQSCHTIAGTKANGKVGPDLTHFASRETLGAGVLDNNRGSLTAWISDPQAIKPGILMPNFRLSSEQISALVVYLETLK